MADLEKRDWALLVRRIHEGQCTPFLGAGACVGTLPLGGEIAADWARQYDFPVDEDANNLPRVAQFLALGDPSFPKQEIRARLAGKGPPDFSAPGEPHAVLAELGLPVYLTTNYDDFMVQALRRAGRHPQRDFCRWRGRADDGPASVFAGPEGYDPSPATPLVYHLHGLLEELDSLVLTEDDYLDFLVSLSRDQTLVPPRIQEALAATSLLFVGYQLADWNFRVLFRGLVETVARSDRLLNVTVQLPRQGDAEKVRAIHRYLDDYYDEMKVKVYWGDARQFAAELWCNWVAFRDANGGG